MRQLYLIISLLIALTANAAISFKAQNPGTVLEGDKFQITFTLQGGEGSGFRGPRLDGCKLITDRGTSSFSSYQSINGVVATSARIDYTCVYRAEKAGKVNVPAVSITVDGKQYKSQPFSFTISKNTGKPNQRIHQQKSLFDEEYETHTPDAITGTELFVKIMLSKESAYEQEPIECVIKLYTQYGIESFMPTTQPSFDGFLIEEIPIQNQQVQEESYNGKRYNTAILKKCIICPQKSGKLTINSGKYDLTAIKHETVSFGFGHAMSRMPIREKLSISSNSATINILPLPQPQPENFSGAVGQFTVDSKLNSNSFRTGESASLLYVVSGTGNLKYIKEPTIEFPAEFELYTPKSDSKIDVTGGTMKGTVTFEYTFVPQNVGKFQIPEQDFVYFDPTQKEYVTLKSKSLAIDVAKGLGVNQQDVEIKNSDISDIKHGINNLTTTTKLYFYTFGYWIIYLLLIAITFVFIKQYKKHLRLNADIVGLRLAKANKVAKKRLKLAHKLMSTNKNKEFYEEIVNALWGYLSDKLSIPASQLLRENVSAVLVEYGADESLTKSVIEILDECDMALYSPQSSENKIGDIYNKTVSVINNIETIKHKRK